MKDRWGNEIRVGDGVWWRSIMSGEIGLIQRFDNEDVEVLKANGEEDRWSVQLVEKADSEFKYSLEARIKQLKQDHLTGHEAWDLISPFLAINVGKDRERSELWITVYTIIYTALMEYDKTRGLK